VPVDRLVQVALVDLLGNLRQLAVTDVAAKADDAGEENLFGRPGALVFNLPMFKLVEKVGGLLVA